MIGSNTDAALGGPAILMTHDAREGALDPRDRERWAVPAGLAMLIGQLLNTLGPVQTYEHISTEGVGVYVLVAF